MEPLEEFFTPPYSWQEVHCHLADLHSVAAAELAYGEVFRTDWSAPGFFVFVLPSTTDSLNLRHFMVELKEALSEKHFQSWGEPLNYLSLGRFDQQTTTKLHLDGAPERSYLMLGYEATSVRSEFHIADFTRCAHDLGITPAEFLERHNPMFASGQSTLDGYISNVRDWSEDHPRVVLINNSHASPSDPHHSAGVFHGATILTPDPAARRIINSTLMAPASLAGTDMSAQQKKFLTTREISGVI